MSGETQEQRDELHKLHTLIVEQFGGHAWDAIARQATEWRDANNMSWALTYEYAIIRAREKLNGPVLTLDASEYEEIIKAQDIMESTS